MNRIFSIILAILIPVLSFAQEQEDHRTKKQKNYSPRKKYKLAKKLYNQGSYFNSLTYYTEVYEKKPNKYQALERAAFINYQLRDYNKAEDLYKKLIETETVKYPDMRYMYALMLKYNGKYEGAKAEFGAFNQEYKEGDAATMKALSNKHIEGCDLALKLQAKPDKVKIEHLDSRVNNPFTDFAPKIVTNPDDIVYSSIKSDTVLNLTNIKESGAEYRAKIYSAKYDGNAWTSTTLPDIINNPAFHNGNGVFSADKKRFYFTRCNENENLKMICAIYMSEHNNGNFSEPVILGESINTEQSTNTQPAVATNEQGKEVLYFVSDRKGGQGGMDIWYAVNNGDNTFSAATNLGKSINTNQDEITPYYHQAVKTLYFSSNGHANVGGFDIFRAEGKETEWSMPENIGFPINSSVDDIYYVISETDKKTGYFVSNRPGGFNLKSETCCDDIYKATLIRDVFLKGFVASSKEPEKPLKDANVAFYTKNQYDGTLALTSTFTTGEDESFIVPIDPEKVYQVNATKAGYWGSEKLLEPKKEKVVNDTIYKTFLIDEIARQKLVLKRIYYEFDRADLRREDKLTLDSLSSLLKENGKWTLEIYGHTDWKGSDAYNMVLGKKRAQAAADYLVAKHKIDVNRLSLISKGEGEPLMPNENPAGVDDPIGRANNRRVEFKVNTNDKDFEVEIEYIDERRKDTR